VELNDLYSSPNIIQLIKIEKVMGRACNKYGGRELDVYRILVGNQRERGHLEEPASYEKKKNKQFQCLLYSVL
jgi:hypothetical protein